MSLDESTNVLDGVSSSNTERVQDSTRRSTPVRPAKPTSSAPSAIDYKSLLSGSEIVDAVVVPVREISDAVKVFSQFLYHPRHRCKYILNHYETVDGLGTRRVLLQAAAATDTQKTPSNDDEPVRTALSFFNEHVARKFPLWRFVSKETTVEWTHRSWGFREALREVLAAIRRDAKACTSNVGAWDDDDPDDVTTAYEQVGHLAHFNLPRSLVPYGELIGSLMLETHSNIHLVVNKERCIEDTFRTFPMRVLASRDPLASDPGWGASNGALIDFNVTVRSGGCVYSFPFDKVFWNSRLEGEHTRLIQSMCAEASLPSKSSPQAVALRDSVLFDVCAGVGPFVIPALRHFGLLEVYANDLNPHSVAALRDNLTRNKVTTSGGLQQGSIELYQLDGVEFLRSIVAPRLRTASGKDGIIPLPPTKVAHLVMNLPGSAIDLFVPALRDHLLPIVLGDVCSCREVMAHVYTFSSSSEPLDNVHQRLCACLYPYAPKTDDCIALHLVRDVAPKKVMVCASVRLSQFIRISSPSDVVEQMSDTSPRASSCFSSKRGRNEELTM